MGKDGNGNGRGGGVNWTVVATAVSVVLILAVVGPLVWRLVVQANADDMRVVGIILIVLVIFGVFVLALIGALLAISKMQLRLLQQDDADEIRKAQQLNSQLARATEAALRGHSSALNERDQAAQMFQREWGRRGAMVDDGQGGYFDGSIGQDIELG